jgi:hypothetical protein
VIWSLYYLFKGGSRTKGDLEKADVRRIGALIGQGVAERVKKELASA